MKTTIAAAIASLLIAILTGCAGTVAEHGATGFREGVPTLRLSGIIAPEIAAVLWVEYVASNNTRSCQRIDGESGRVLMTKHHRYDIPEEKGRYALNILLDPRDDTGCAYTPRTVYLTAADRRNGLRSNAYVGILALDDSGQPALPARHVDCQHPTGGTGAFACSLPRVEIKPGLYCPGPAALACSSNCAATLNIRLVEPPRTTALWALPPGCPGARTSP